MTAEQWEIVGTIVAIILFIFSGLGLSYKGFKAWKSADETIFEKKRWGKFDLIVGGGLTIMAIVCVFFLIHLVKYTNIITKKETAPTIPVSTESVMSEKATDEEAQGSNTVFAKSLNYNGATYTGYVNESRQPDGQGVMTYSDGKVYDGNWVNGVRQGQGRMTYAEGEVYDGEWLNGKRNGKGVYTWNDKKQYDGLYVDDIREGYGVFSGWTDLTNGYSGTYYGNSKNDKFEGSGHFIYDNGDKFEGIYKDNVFWIGVYIKNNGSQFDVVDGKIQSNSDESR